MSYVVYYFLYTYMDYYCAKINETLLALLIINKGYAHM